ncbi:formyltransferase family protein [Sphingopyxis sp. MSC1_008]|jgi:methionyl-tRNA formyltransferase|uniref:formyltransferase family protein n=1 Tax=Sphingopyxis sp. MSC1_008 TaxID=2909265 RepID=UPI0020BD88DA|nr:formyltransferase family protein [Sphingopyxis sp. MSC1_008]
MKPIVVITRSDTGYAREVVRHLCDAGQAPALILIGSRVESLLFNLRSLRRVMRRLGVVEAIRRLRRSRSAPSFPVEAAALSAQAEQYGTPLRPYDSVNNGTMILSINALDDPVVVLAGCGLVDRSVIHVARGGCVNGHPAILPGIRGVDVVEWALVGEDEPLGVTAHLVVPQVDAGEILRVERVEPEAGEDFDAYNHRLVLRQAANLARAALDVANGSARKSPNSTDQGVLRFAAPDGVHREAREAFARRAALAKEQL